MRGRFEDVVREASKADLAEELALDAGWLEQRAILDAEDAAELLETQRHAAANESVYGSRLWRTRRAIFTLGDEPVPTETWTTKMNRARAERAARTPYTGDKT